MKDLESSMLQVRTLKKLILKSMRKMLQLKLTKALKLSKIKQNLQNFKSNYKLPEQQKKTLSEKEDS
jgi:hypothetical protein